MPNLLPDSGGRGPDPRRDEVELVMAVSTAGVVSDPIADMLTRVRNANSARHTDVRVPASRLKLEIARVLRDEGYIAGYEIERNADRPGDEVRITFKARPDRSCRARLATQQEIADLHASGAWPEGWTLDPACLMCALVSFLRHRKCP